MNIKRFPECPFKKSHCKNAGKNKDLVEHFFLAENKGSLMSPCKKIWTKVENPLKKKIKDV